MSFVQIVRTNSNITTITYNDLDSLMYTAPTQDTPESPGTTMDWECHRACKAGRMYVMAIFFSLLVCFQLYFILAWRQRLRVLRKHTISESLVQRGRRESLDLETKETEVETESTNTTTKLNWVQSNSVRSTDLALSGYNSLLLRTSSVSEQCCV